MKQQHLLCAVFFAFVAVSSHSVKYATANYMQGTVYINATTGAAEFKPHVIDRDNGVAYGYYNNTINATGLAVLEIQTRRDDSISNEQLMYAAGFLEGVLTAREIWLNYINSRDTLIRFGVDLPKAEAWLAEQNSWMRSMIESHPSDEDAFWRHVAYTMAQFDGLYAGYMSAARPDWDTTIYVVQLLNSMADHMDLKTILNPREGGMNLHQSEEKIEEQFVTKGHCSVIVKVTPGFENIFMFHNTWFVYAVTMRIFKHYHLNVRDSATGASSMSFSSYPGFIHSVDDYYQLSSEMVMLQTTNEINNPTLYRHVTSQSLLSWQRVRVANMMAHSGREWYEQVRRYNSGTYNNQYMIVDLKKVTLGHELADGTLWVIEQIPGLVVGADQTTILRAGYWPSYNVPFYPIIYNLTGYLAESQMKPHMDYVFSYQVAARANIMRRDQSKIVDIASLQEFARHNDYLHDEYSGGNPSRTICSRVDLDENYPSPYGCYDAKVCDVFMARNMSTLMISGPTTSHNLPPFSWDNFPNASSHVGLPTTYNFDWVLTKPRL